jgi:hypothetical protein
MPGCVPAADLPCARAWECRSARRGAIDDAARVTGGARARSPDLRVFLDRHRIETRLLAELREPGELRRLRPVPGRRYSSRASVLLPPSVTATIDPSNHLTASKARRWARPRAVSFAAVTVKRGDQVALMPCG